MDNNENKAPNGEHRNAEKGQNNAQNRRRRPGRNHKHGNRSHENPSSPRERSEENLIKPEKSPVSEVKENEDEWISLSEAETANYPEHSDACAACEDASSAAGDAPTEDELKKVEVVGVRFKKAGKVYYFAPGEFKLRVGDSAVVETARGLEFGDIACGNRMVREKDIIQPLRPVVRIATAEDVAHNEENKKKESEAFAIGLKKIEEHKLDMKLVDVEYTFDNSKLLFYFTSAGRVDFRELVKDLASVFRTRIELRQIGIRDEAKLMGGLGVCGRPLCCASFLSDFVQVSIKMAKEQNLSLNSTKISGTCGRLMCCLRYEHESYEAELRSMPQVDSTVKTEDGVGVVTEINPIGGLIKVRLTDKSDAPPKFYKKDAVKVLKAVKREPDESGDEEPDSQE